MEANAAHSISMSRTSSVDAQAVVRTPSVNQDENLRGNQGQVQQEQASSAGHEVQRRTLEFQINMQQKRRRLLRQMQKDIGITINSYTVVLVLLGSVTFVVFLQPPGGLGDDGRMKQKGPTVTLFANLALGGFYFSMAGIAVCMSCVAFVLPRCTQHARHMLVSEMNLQCTAVGFENSGHQKMLDIEVKTNDRISRTLKVAQIHQVLANLFFTLSLATSTEVFLATAYLVIDAQALKSLHGPFWSIVNLMVQGLYLLYTLLLLLHIVRAVIDLLVDLLKLIKRLSSTLGARLRKFRIRL